MEQQDKPQEELKKDENVISDYYDNVKKSEMEGHEMGIRKARNALFFTAGLFLVLEIIQASSSGVAWTPFLIAILVIEVGVFILLGFWTKTKPFSAIVVGIILYLLLWAFAIITTQEWRAVYGGIVVRIITLGVLISALKPAKAWEDLKKSS